MADWSQSRQGDTKVEGHNESNWLTGTFSNRPFVVGALFLGTYFVPFLVLIGLALAYIFKRQPEEEWELSHFIYLIRTFWIAVLGLLFVAVLSGGGLVLLDSLGNDIDSGAVAVGLFVPALLASVPLLAFCGVRIILSLMRSSSHRPMPNPRGWLL